MQDCFIKGKMYPLKFGILGDGKKLFEMGGKQEMGGLIQNGRINPLSANPNCFSVFDHFVKLALKGLRVFRQLFWYFFYVFSAIKCFKYMLYNLPLKNILN